MQCRIGVAIIQVFHKKMNKQEKEYAGEEAESVKIQANDCDRTARFLLEEMRQELDVQLCTEGIRLAAHSMEKPGFTVQEENGTVTVQYGSRVDFCRALAAVCAHAGESGWQAQESCVFDDFGVSLDCSRNAVMKPEAVCRFLRLAALMGYRFVGLYLEDTVEVEGEPCFGNQRGAYTGAQLQALDHYAESLGVELRAYIQTLAHINQITRYQTYEPIIDTDDILLVGDERTYQLLDRLLGSISQNIRSRKLNIGMDEAHMAGLGKYLDRNGYHPRTEVLLEHLHRVLELCRKYGFQTQMWSDLFFHQMDGKTCLNAGDVPRIPPEVELAYWDYYSCDKEHYKEILRQHRQMTDRVAFAAGAWKWTGFTPHNSYSMETGRAGLAACRESGVRSVVVTTWGDNGAEASPFSVLPALYADAQLAYDAPEDAARFCSITGISLHDFLKIDLPCRFSERAGVHNNASKYLLYQDALYGTFDSVVPDGIAAFYSETAEQLEPLCGTPRFGYVFETQRQLCRVLSHKAALSRTIYEAYHAQDRGCLQRLAQEEMPQLLADLGAFRQVFRRQWMQDNKPFGFEVQTIRLGGLEARLQEVRGVLLQYLNGELSCIEELEAPRIPFSYFEEQDLEKLNYNLWSVIVTPGVIG